MDIQDSEPTLQPGIVEPGGAPGVARPTLGDHDHAFGSATGKPGIAARAMDTATDVSHGIGEVAGALKYAVDKLSDRLAEARKPGQPLGIVSAIARQAPLSSLFVAFLVGVALTRRR